MSAAPFFSDQTPAEPLKLAARLTTTTRPASQVRVYAHFAVIKGGPTMNWDRVEGNWKQFKGQIQQKWGNLTNDDLDVIEGKRTELSGRLQQRYGMAKDAAEREIDSWLKTLN
jgi:uncharacterized protein YjbJ (UPF0337 family)